MAEVQQWFSICKGTRKYHRVSSQPYNQRLPCFGVQAILNTVLIPINANVMLHLTASHCFLWPLHVQRWSRPLYTICGHKGMDKISQLLACGWLEILACRRPSCWVSFVTVSKMLWFKDFYYNNTATFSFWLPWSLFTRYTMKYANNLTFATVKVS